MVLIPDEAVRAKMALVDASCVTSAHIEVMRVGMSEPDVYIVVDPNLLNRMVQGLRQAARPELIRSGRVDAIWFKISNGGVSPWIDFNTDNEDECLSPLFTEALREIGVPVPRSQESASSGAPSIHVYGQNMEWPDAKPDEYVRGLYAAVPPPPIGLMHIESKYETYFQPDPDKPSYALLIKGLSEAMVPSQSKDLPDTLSVGGIHKWETIRFNTDRETDCISPWFVAALKAEGIPVPGWRTGAPVAKERLHAFSGGVKTVPDVWSRRKVWNLKPEDVAYAELWLLADPFKVTVEDSGIIALLLQGVQEATDTGIMDRVENIRFILRDGVVTDKFHFFTEQEHETFSPAFVEGLRMIGVHISGRKT